MVKYTFRQYLAAQGLDSDEMVPANFFEGPILPASVDPDAAVPTDATVHDLLDADEVQMMGITETHREEAEAFRRRIKHARDCVFLDEVYGELQAVPDVDFDVPKIAWKEAALEIEGLDSPPDNDTNSNESGAQAGLDMF